MGLLTLFTMALGIAQKLGFKVDANLFSVALRAALLLTVIGAGLVGYFHDDLIGRITLGVVAVGSVIEYALLEGWLEQYLPTI